MTGELVALTPTGDREQQAQALLLHANVLLEEGRVGFAPVLGGVPAPARRARSAAPPLHGAHPAGLRRPAARPPRQAPARIDEAAAIGERLAEPDTANVRMSQRLELVRARAVAGRAEPLRRRGGRPLDGRAGARPRRGRGFHCSRRRPGAARRHVRVPYATSAAGARTAPTSGRSSCPSSRMLPSRWRTRPLCAELLAELAPMSRYLRCQRRPRRVRGKSRARQPARLAAVAGRPRTGTRAPRWRLHGLRAARCRATCRGQGPPGESLDAEPR